jgi:hypothetical protein
MNLQKTEILDHGNGKVARLCGKAAYVKDVSPRTETWYKADGTGELAQHSEARGSVPEVNHGVVHRNNALLPGEASPRRCGGFRSTREAGAPAAAMRRAGRSEESAEGIVAAMQSVSSRRRVTRPVKDAARHGGRRPEPKKWNQPEAGHG